MEFYEDWYRPELMSVIAVGHFDAARVEAMIRERFGDLENPPDAPPRTTPVIPDHPETLFATFTDPELTGTAVAVYTKLPTPPEGTGRAYRASLVEGLYHRMLNDRLYELGHGPEPPFLYAFSDTDVIVRAGQVDQQEVGVEPGKALEGLRALLTEIERVRRHGFTEGELNRNKLDLLRAYEQTLVERTARSSGSFAAEYSRAYLTDEPIPGIDVEVDMVTTYLPTITLEEVEALAGRRTGDANRVILVSAPEGQAETLPSNDQLLATFQEVQELELDPYEDTGFETELMAETPEPGEIVERREIEEIGVTEWTLSNGATVVLKPTSFRNDEVYLFGFSPGGHSTLGDERYLSGSYAADVVAMGGLGTMDEIALAKAMAGRVADVAPYVDELEEGVRAGGSAQDIEAVFQLAHLAIAHPRYDEAAIESYRGRVRPGLENRLADPQQVFVERFFQALAQDHPRRQPLTPERLDQIDPRVAMEVYEERFADAGDFTFVLAGTFRPEDVEGLVETYLASLPATDREETWRDVGVERPSEPVEIVVERGIEPKATVWLVLHGDAPWSREEEHTLATLGRVLQIRLREVLREELGAVYGASVETELLLAPPGSLQRVDPLRLRAGPGPGAGGAGARGDRGLPRRRAAGGAGEPGDSAAAERPRGADPEQRLLGPGAGGGLRPGGRPPAHPGLRGAGRGGDAGGPAGGGADVPGLGDESAGHPPPGDRRRRGAVTSTPLEPDGAEMRRWVDAAMERIVRHAESLSDQPAADVAGAMGLARSLAEPVPEEGAPLDGLLELLFDRAVPKSFNASGPGYLGFIPGGGLFATAVADLIAGSVNRFTGVLAAAPALVQLEANAIRWLTEIVGYPAGARGILTSGGSLASLTALVTARREHLPEDFLSGVIYISDQCHHCLPKAAALAGFPAGNVRRLPTGEDFRLRPETLEAAIAEDRRRGLTPFLVVGNAGTANTGAVDPLPKIAEIARREGLWFHADAAYGGFFAMTDAGPGGPGRPGGGRLDRPRPPQGALPPLRQRRPPGAGRRRPAPDPRLRRQLPAGGPGRPRPLRPAPGRPGAVETVPGLADLAAGEAPRPRRLPGGPGREARSRPLGGGRGGGAPPRAPRRPAGPLPLRLPDRARGRLPGGGGRDRAPDPRGGEREEAGLPHRHRAARRPARRPVLRPLRPHPPGAGGDGDRGPAGGDRGHGAGFSIDFPFPPIAIPRPSLTSIDLDIRPETAHAMDQPSSFLVLSFLLFAVTAALLVSPPLRAQGQGESSGLDYPETRKVDQVDDFHGTTVADPYRWLEQDVREADDVRAWVEAQNEVTFGYLRGIEEREAIRERLTELWNYERYSPYTKEGGRYFFLKNDGLQDQQVLYTRRTLLEEPRVLLDPNTWSEDGTVAIGGLSASPDGRYLAYARAESGSDWRTWRVLEIDTGDELDDRLEWTKFTELAWTSDARGFFYARYPEPEEGSRYQAVAENQRIYYHRLGTPQERDVLVYARPHQPDVGYGLGVSDDGRWLLLTGTRGTSGNLLLVKDLTEPYGMPREIVGTMEDDVWPIGVIGDSLYVQTDRGAPRHRVMAIDLAGEPGRRGVAGGGAGGRGHAGGRHPGGQPPDRPVPGRRRQPGASLRARR